jgi:hypothetical protein
MRPSTPKDAPHRHGPGAEAPFNVHRLATRQGLQPAANSTFGGFEENLSEIALLLGGSILLRDLRKGAF